MRKLSIIAFFILVLSGCSKDEEPGREAHIDYRGSPAVDGLGWVLLFSDQTFEIPSNLSDEFKVDDLKVKVVYEKTSKQFPCICSQPKYMVDIISIVKIA